MLSQPPSKQISRYWLLAAPCLCAVWYALAIRESFWIDELHTAWCVGGPWNEVASRAASGNQSPFYFYVAKLWFTTIRFISSQPFAEDQIPLDALMCVSLRIFSLLGWWLMIYAVMKIFISSLQSETSNKADGLRSWIPVLAAILWFGLDRNAFFYALEVRPYAWVACVATLLFSATLKTIDLYGQRSGSRQRNVIQDNVIWVVLATALFYLHYTAIFYIAYVAIVRIVFGAFRASREKKNDVVISICAFAVLITPGIKQLILISVHAKNWAYFSGTINAERIMTLLPLFNVIMFPLVFLMLSELIRIAYRRLSSQMPLDVKKTVANSASRELAVISIAGVVFAVAIMMFFTAIGSIPIFHPRYAIAFYPVAILSGLLLVNFNPSTTKKLICLVFATLLLGYHQNSLALWQQGQFIAWQRDEPWEEVVEILKAEMDSNSALAIAPNLIETQVEEMDSIKDDTYLRFPIAVFQFGWRSTYPGIIYENNSSRDIGMIDWTFDRNTTLWIIERGPPASYEPRSSKSIIRYQRGNLTLSEQPYY